MRLALRATTCRRTHIPATEFAPDVFKYKKEFSKYADALALLVHGLTPATRAKIDKGRVSCCLPCRGICTQVAHRGRAQRGGQVPSASSRRSRRTGRPTAAARCAILRHRRALGRPRGSPGKGRCAATPHCFLVGMQRRRRGAARALPRPQQHGDVQVPLLPQPGDRATPSTRAPTPEDLAEGSKAKLMSRLQSLTSRRMPTRKRSAAASASTRSAATRSPACRAW